MQDYDETLPAAGMKGGAYPAPVTKGTIHWYRVIEPYLKSTQVLKCPSVKKGYRVYCTFQDDSGLVNIGNGKGYDTILLTYGICMAQSPDSGPLKGLGAMPMDAAPRTLTCRISKAPTSPSWMDM